MRKGLLALILIIGIMATVTACGKESTVNKDNTGNKNNNKIQTNSSKINTASAKKESNSNTVKGNSSKSDESTEDTYDYLGIAVPKGQVWKKFSDNVNNGENNGIFTNYGDKSGILYGYVSDYFMSDEALAESKKKEGWDKQKIIDGSRTLYQIAVYKKGRVPNENEIPESIKCKHMEKIGENDGKVYVFYWDDFNGEGLSDLSNNKYKQLYEDMMNFKKNIRIFTPKPDAVEAEKKKLQEFGKDAEKALKEADAKEAASKNNIKKAAEIEFSTKDLNVNRITSDIFKKNKITMINVWATFCRPCIKEMPDIEALSEELKDKGVGVIGIVGDTVDGNFKENKGNIELARNIVSRTKVKYPNLITTEGLSKIIPVSAYPTTLFVNSEGKVVGDVIVGSKGKNAYKKMILELLK